ncbi:nucleotidyltransferase domain-containing protein [Microbulbifer pacificus]|uniref:nucleotidyltransferase domain-containing protein n=1 Tax=Microbulbifer pacificus TaxID=407164 RepID=UPI000CF4C3BE|nr:nucleotidyltransferase domain-containing protein [Microbulbifer pacificus]
MAIESGAWGLSSETITRLQQVFERHPEVESALLYGSRAKGNYRKGSDIDLTLIGPELQPLHLIQIETEIDELLTPYSFDLSIYSELESPELLDHIERVGVEFYRRGASL